MKLVIINGSPRVKGRTRIATKFISNKYNGELIDLSTGEIPLYNGQEEQTQFPAIKNLRKLVKEADGVLLATPEYHNGMSGVLKNTLDFLGSEHFSHKPVALLAVAGGGKGGINALNNMRTVGRGVYANVIPRQLVLDPHCFDYEQESLLEEPAKQVAQLMDDLKLYMKGYSSIRS